MRRDLTTGSQKTIRVLPQPAPLVPLLPRDESRLDRTVADGERRSAIVGRWRTVPAGVRPLE